MENLTLFDSSILNLRSLNNSNKIKLYSRLKKEDFQNMLDDTKRIFEALENTQAVTVPEVTRELDSLMGKLSRCKSSFTNLKKSNSRNKKRTKYFDMLEKLYLFEELSHKVRDIKAYSSHNEICGGNMYSSLLDLVLLLDDKQTLAFNAENDSRLLVNAHLKTDQKLVAQAYNYSLFHKDKVQIITNDLDIARLAYSMGKVLESKQYCMMDQEIGAHAFMNPVKVFLPCKGSYADELSLEDISYKSPSFSKQKEIFSHQEIHQNVIANYKKISLPPLNRAV